MIKAKSANGTVVTIPVAAPPYADRASYSGGPVVIADGGDKYLTWDALGSGVALLNLTDPEKPTVLAGGIYAVTVLVAASVLTPTGGGLDITLHLDQLAEDSVAEVRAAPMPGGLTQGTVLASLSNTWYIPANGVISVEVVNRDGTVPCSPSLLEALIQRIA